MKYLISWIANNNDFKDGQAIKNGPTYLYHQYYYNYDKHFLLSSSKGDDTKVEFLINLLKKDFKDHYVEPIYLNVSDVINLNEIRTKLEKWLSSFNEDELDIFISPGTPAMQTAWYFIHMGLKLNTSLYQTRPTQFSKDKSKPERIKIEIEQSQVPVAVTILENDIEGSENIKFDEEYKLTSSIIPIYKRALQIAHTDNVSAIIYGETGTGKEHLANYIHKNSSRKGKPFETINCSALGDQLLESRLFGYAKGSFTGANENTKGVFENCDGGTIFLDEIGDISPYMQQVLLRVIQQKEIQPIGGKSKKVDVRIIFATHRDLAQRCQEDKFRWDLYYRLTIAELQLPSLLQRGKDELKEMISFFNKKAMRKFRRNKTLQFDKNCLKLMMDYHYPGNIRQLENLIERLYVFNEHEVNVEALPSHMTESETEHPLNMEYVEKEHIKRVLKIKKGNQLQTQLALGFGSINTLKNKMKQYSINAELYE